MSQNASAAPPKWKRPDLDHVSDAMVYDIARSTASVLSAGLRRLARDAQNEDDRAHWEARRRLVKQHARALDPDDRAAIIAQNEAWNLEKRTLPLPND